MTVQAKDFSSESCQKDRLRSGVQARPKSVLYGHQTAHQTCP